MSFQCNSRLRVGAGGLLLGLLALAASPAAAHQVWLAQVGSRAQLHFGEFGDNLKEVSPGYLDKLVKPSATLVSASGEQVLEASRTRDAITFAGRAAKGQSIVAADLAYPLLEGKEGDKPARTAWTPAARYVADLSAQAPKLTLDAVPTGKAGEFQVTFRGAPLAKAEVSLVAASSWSLTGTTDEQGKVSFSLPWKGTYALLVRHKDEHAGKRKAASGADEAYDAASFATTLTFTTSTGLPSPPAPPAAKPNAMPAPAAAEAPKKTPAAEAPKKK